MIPVLSLVYGVGDYSGWWDAVFGRAALAGTVERLASSSGYPVAFVFDEDPGYRRLEHFLSARTSNTEVKRRESLRERPKLITRVGGSDAAIQVPKGWPKFVAVNAESPIVYSYDAVAPNVIGADIQWVATIRQARDWIQSQRDTERVLVNIVLISVLSIALVVYEERKAA